MKLHHRRWAGVLTLVGLLLASPVVRGSEKPTTSFAADRQRAATAQQYLFVLVHEEEDDAVRAARVALETTAAKLTPPARVTYLDRRSEADREFLQQAGLKRAPVPLVLAMAPNGAITAGMPAAEATAERLQAARVGPALQQCLKALQDDKLVVVSVQNAKITDGAAALQGAREFAADPLYAEFTVVVPVDPTNAADRDFLSGLDIDSQTTEATTLLLAPPGRLLGRLSGAVDKEELELALRRGMSACGPAGCGR